MRYSALVSGSADSSGDIETAAEGDASDLRPSGSMRERVEVPRRVGRFVILRTIGAGGMGRVLLGYDETLSRRVAIKLWHAHTGRDDDLRGRMLREAQALARLSHPNIVQIYEVAEYGAQLYLAMEYVEGRTLRQWVMEEEPRLPLLLDRFVQAGQGLAAGHREGILHRDFKPDNVMVGDDGRVRVLDFGLARADGQEVDTPSSQAARSFAGEGTDSFEIPLTRAGGVIGTPAYIAPEQLAGQETDVRSDIYSYCVSLWESLHGVRPYTGKDARELGAAIEGQEPRVSDRTVPRWLRAVLLRGLAPKPEARWADMDALLDALRSGAHRRRRRWSILGVAALSGLVAAGLSLQVAAHARKEAACERRGAVIDETVGAAEFASVHEALIGSGEPYAPRTAEQVAARLEGYSAAWSEGQARVCRLATVDKTWSVETAARAEACLLERRRDLAALVGVLREPDRMTVMRAVEAVSSLPALELCLDEAALARQILPPPEARDTIDAIAADIARTRSLAALGRYAEGLALAEPLIALADGVDWSQLSVEARLSTARLAILLGNEETEATAELIEDAFFLALDAGLDALATRAAIELLEYSGLQLLHIAEGERWARLARGLVVRLGLERLPLEAALTCHVADLQRVQGQLETARATIERCYELRLAAYGPGHPMVGFALDAHANLASMGGDPETARDLLLRSIEILEPAYGRSHPRVARWYSDIGEVYAKLGRNQEAEEAYLQALAINENVFGKRHKRVAGFHFGLGQLYAGTGRLSEAAERLELAADLFVGRRPMQIASLSRLIEVYRRSEKLPQAIVASERALELYEEGVGAEDVSLAANIVELAELHRDNGDLEAAAELMARAERLGAGTGSSSAGSALGGATIKAHRVMPSPQ